MRNLIIYICFVIVGTILLVYLGISELYIREQNNLTNEIFEEAKETKDFDKFVKYQSKHYRLISSDEVDSFMFVAYQIITNENNNEHLIIVLPTENIESAASKDDKSDQTKLIIQSENHLLDTSVYEEAISFGYREDQIGFMFFSLRTNQDKTLSIKYYDYNNVEIYNKDLAINGNITEEEITNSFKNGYTLEEIKELMDIDEKLKNTLIVRITIYLAVAIFIPFVYKLIKELTIRKKRET